MDRRWAMMKSSPEIAPNCPRCASSNTKFCYYNNYSLSQPRYFCKGCRRYWTKGGSLRNVPIGGGCRKSRRGRSTKPLTSSADHTTSSYMCSSDGGDSLVPHDSNGQDIDMAAVFAKFLDPNSETEVRDHETDTKEDDLFFELTSSLGSNNNQGESFLIDCENSGELFCEEVVQEFSLAGHENFEASCYDTNFGLDDLLSDQAPGPEAMWLNYDEQSLEPDTFCGSMVNQLQFPFSNDDNQTKGSDNGNNGLIDHDWRIGSCFDVTSSEVFSRP